MNIVLNLILAAQILAALGMIGLILMQHGKGADMGASFGSGSAGSLFGATGGANFLSRTTAVLAVVFFVSTLCLAYFGGDQRASSGTGSVLENPALVQPAAPAESSTPATPGNAETPANTATPQAPSTPAAPATGADAIPKQ